MIVTQEYIKKIQDTFIHHTLTLLVDSNGIKIFYMAGNTGVIHSTLIMFTTEGIVLHGDLWTKALSTNRGYGLDWFLGLTDPNYMASKFLERTQLCRDSIKQVAVRQARAAMDKEKKAKLLDLARICNSESEFDILTTMYNVLDNHWDHVFYSYPIAEYVYLIAVQKRFKELYSEMVGVG